MFDSKTRKHAVPIKSMTVAAAIFLAVLHGQGIGWAQDTVPQGPGDVDPQTAGEVGAAPDGQGPSEADATDLAAALGVDAAELSTVESSKGLLAKRADAVTQSQSARAELASKSVGLEQTTAILTQQLGDPGMPAAALPKLRVDLASLQVQRARLAGLMEERDQTTRELQALVERVASHVAALEARAKQEESAPVVERRNAEAEALAALEEAREREAASRDATIRELLAREREAAETFLLNTRQHIDVLNAVEEQTRESAKAFSDSKAALLSQIDEFPEEPGESVRRKQIDPVFAQALTLRREARLRLADARALVHETETELTEAEDELEAAEKKLESEKKRAPQLSRAVGERRVALAEAELKVARQSYEGGKELLHAYEVRVADYRGRIAFLSETTESLANQISSDQRGKFFSLSDDENWRDAIDGLREGIDRLIDGGLARGRQLIELDVSWGVWTWLGGLLWRVLLVVFLLRFLLSFLPGQIQELTTSLFRRRFFRIRPRLTIKLAELLNGLARPVLTYIAIRFLASYVVGAFEEVRFLSWLVDGFFAYWICVELASALFLPRWYRREHGKSSAADVAAMNEAEASAIADVFGLELERARRLVRSVRVIIIFGLLASYVPQLVQQVAGLTLIWWLVDTGALVGLAFIVYWVISTWKEEIATLFARLARDRLPKAVDFVSRHKDRRWGVLVIAVASVYVIVVEVALVARKYLVDTEVSKRLSNFVFRKKIELQAREREESAEREVDVGSLPKEYRAAFGLDPLDADSELFVDRSEYLQRIEETYRTWRLERAQGSIALVGESGVGKTTLLRRLVRDLEEDDSENPLPVYFHSSSHRAHKRAEMLAHIAELFGVPQTDDKAELIEAILELEPRVVVIDDCHHFFMRQIGGFHGLETLLDVVNLTDERHFFVLSFNVFAWSYVNRVGSRQHYFGDVLTLASWSDADIQRLIELRSNSTGWTSSFSELVVTHDEDQLDHFYEVVKTARGYFRYLHEFSDGNPSLAMTFWLRSVRPGDGHVMHVSLFRRPKADALVGITDNHWFVLTAIAQHGSLDAREVAGVVNVDEGFCHLALNYFEERGVVVRDPETRRSNLAPLHFKQVLRHLSNSNFLYS